MADWFLQYDASQTGEYGAALVRIIVAVILGGLIGFERELRDKPAGFRTIILICLGACLFAIASEVVGAPDGERTRIAAQVVSGIGFLGAGAILRDRQTIVGLTTAATIWAVAAVGVAVGFGHLVLGAYGAGLILVALFIFDVVEKWIGDRRDIQDYDLTTHPDDKAIERIRNMFGEADLRIRKLRFHEDGERIHFTVIAMGNKHAHETLRFSLARSKSFTLLRS